MCLLAKVLLAGALLVEVLPLGVLLVVEKEMLPAASVFLEKREKILPGLEIPGEEKALLLFGALLVLWYSWHLFSSVGWTGGHRHFYFWSLPMCRCAVLRMRIREYKCNRCRSGISMNERVRIVTLKACAKVETATDGDVFVRLVVTFFRRTPRCIIAAKVGALLPIEEIGPDRKRLIGLPLLLTDGGSLSTCNTIQKVSYRWK